MCGNNEKFMCGPRCVETCVSKPSSSETCKFGCFCATGYVRQSNKTGSPCVKREECRRMDEQPVCGVNEEYLQCGTACPATCDEFRYPLPKPPKACILLCKSGCFCKKGFYRNDDGSCVPREKCCRDHERFNTCGSDCVETCEGQPDVCTRRCIVGCFCGCSDYVRQANVTNSPCIHREECPNKCEDD